MAALPDHLTAFERNRSEHNASNGEALVRYAMRQLDEDFKVFYHPQKSHAELSDPYDRALDIVVVHRHRGILAVSTKFGEINEEQHGLISQYQPRHGHYKIMDPAHQAKDALSKFLADYEPAWQTGLPIGAAVFLPETARSEFFDPKSIFFFQDDLRGRGFAEKLDVFFPYPLQKAEQDKLEGAYVLLCNYLKQHSAAENPYNDRNLISIQPALDEKQIDALADNTPAIKPMMLEGATIHPFIRKSEEIETVDLSPELPPPINNPPVELNEGSETLKEEKKKEILETKKDDFIPDGEDESDVTESESEAYEEEYEAPPLLAFFWQLEEKLNITHESDVQLTALQWGIALIGGAGLISLTYFVFRALGRIIQ